jgi:FdhD protein
MNHPLQTRSVVEWNTGARHQVLDDVATEEPLEIRVDGAPVSVTMRTPGDDVELAVGFLFTEGIIRGRDDVDAAGHVRDADGAIQCNIVDVTLSGDTTFDRERLRRHFFASSSCGICGKASIEAVRARTLTPLRDDGRIDPEWLTSLPESLRTGQAVFGRTGGLHAAALFGGNGALVEIREDIGRHNAVDKIIGHGLLGGTLPLSAHVLLVSGRGGFEIIQKAIAAGVPVIASISAPSSLAIQLASDHGATLIGFLRGERFIVYSGEHRIIRRG